MTEIMARAYRTNPFEFIFADQQLITEANVRTREWRNALFIGNGRLASVLRKRYGVQYWEHNGTVLVHRRAPPMRTSFCPACYPGKVCWVHGDRPRVPGM